MLLFLFTLAVVCQTITASEDHFIRPVSGAVLKRDFRHAHNYFRSKVSPPASNMRRLQWDEDLERKAKEKVRNCSFTHTYPPARTDEFNVVGENLYAGDEFRYSDAGFGIARTWFNESQFYKFSHGSGCKKGCQCGHYKQLVWAETRKLGCAMAICSEIDEGHGRTLVACHYGPIGNKYISESREILPYQVGARCSDCPKDAPRCVVGLCIP